MSDLYHGFSTDLLRQYLSVSGSSYDNEFLKLTRSQFQTQGMTGEGLTGVTQGNEPVPVCLPAMSQAAEAYYKSHRILEL